MSELARLLLAAVYAVAGIAKLADREGARRAVRGFGAPAPIQPLLKTATEEEGMFRRVIVLTTLAAAVAALGAAALEAQAASSAVDPSRLVLSRADFPSGTKYTWARMPASFARGFTAMGVEAQGAYYAAELSRVGPTKYQSVQGLVVTTGSAAQARKAYTAIGAQARQGPKTVVRLAAYGDAQLALFQSPKVGSKVEVLVRRNSVVWQLQVSGEGLLVIPKANLLAELEKYSAKQQRRVGRG